MNTAEELIICSLRGFGKAKTCQRNFRKERDHAIGQTIVMRIYTKFAAKLDRSSVRVMIT
jgi:hypothetical protein